MREHPETSSEKELHRVLSFLSPFKQKFEKIREQSAAERPGYKTESRPTQPGQSMQNHTQIVDGSGQSHQRSYASHLNLHGPQRVAFVWSCTEMALAVMTECSRFPKKSLMSYEGHCVGRTCPTLHHRSHPANEDHRETRLLPPAGHAPPKRAYPRSQRLEEKR